MMDLSSNYTISTQPLVRNTSSERKVPEVVWDSYAVLWRGINVIIAVFFFLCTYVQLNDPDPYIWVPIYTIPALLCVSIAVKAESSDHSVWRTVCGIHIVCCVLAAVYHLALVIEIMSGQLYNPMLHEEGRELAGLVIVVFWLCLCRFASFTSSTVSISRSLTGLLFISVILAMMPMFMWSLCFIEGLSTSLSHCNGMFPGMLGGTALS